MSVWVFGIAFHSLLKLADSTFQVAAFELQARLEVMGMVDHLVEFLAGAELRVRGFEGERPSTGRMFLHHLLR